MLVFRWPSAPRGTSAFDPAAKARKRFNWTLTRSGLQAEGSRLAYGGVVAVSGDGRSPDINPVTSMLRMVLLT